MKVGDSINQLTLVEFTTTRRGKARFVCTCGATKVLEVYSVTSGNTKSCGCRKALATSKAMRTHGEVKSIGGKRVSSPEYRSWQAMKNRCGNSKARDYDHYGGRGITVCERWGEFENFLQDLGRRPTPGHSLDRIDVDGGYTPENCRWATRTEQARNRRYATTKAWILAERLGLKTMTAQHMIWQVRAKDRGNSKWFALSPELEAVVREFLMEVA